MFAKLRWGFLLSGTLLLAGCLDYETRTIKINLETGLVQDTYHGLKSVKEKDGKKDLSEEDWKDLKDKVATPFTGDEDRALVSGINTKLFQEGKGLSGTLTYTVTGVNRLEALYKVLGLPFSVQNGVVVMVTGKDSPYKLISPNGKVLSLMKNQSVVAWPAETKELELTFSGAGKKGTSLLSRYLKEKGTGN
jgi:hypothetical protein